MKRDHVDPYQDQSRVYEGILEAYQVVQQQGKSG